MKKSFVLSYSLLCYIIGLSVVAYYADFFIGYFIPKSINAGQTPSMGSALVINFILLLIFTLSHTVMARPSVKKRMRKYIPFAMERSTYILISSLTLFILCAFWQPIPHEVFDLRGTFLEPVFWTLYALGWAIALFSTFLIDHFDLFGLKQAWYYGHPKNVFSYRFVTPFIYKLVRHPIYLGWLMVHWFTPYLSVGQLFMAIFITIYILIAVEYEERDLTQAFGGQYKQYKKTTPKLIPAASLRKAVKNKNEDFLYF